jgi:hypothetical protein
MQYLQRAWAQSFSCMICNTTACLDPLQLQLAVTALSCSNHSRMCSQCTTLCTPKTCLHSPRPSTGQGSLGNLLKSGARFSRYDMRPSLPSSL